jgi:hypothetical protein
MLTPGTIRFPPWACAEVEWACAKGEKERKPANKTAARAARLTWLRYIWCS